MSSLLGIRLSRRNYSHASSLPESVNHHNQRPEYIRSDGNKATLTFRGIILDGQSEGIIQHSISFGKGNAVLSNVCRILFWDRIRGTQSEYMHDMHIRQCTH